MIRYFLLASFCLSITNCGLGLNREDRHPVIRALAPDKFGATTRFDEDNRFQGWNTGFSWDID